ncbi:MAG: VWA domain-containing protein, partial [Pseudomonadales bacterium]|nr:VWA domain-containing protein [Pseudomonadales bacterium]NIX07974.1 VWA domain-containing protein [Pseudomonadales bacterium]
MLTKFFFMLREGGIKVSITEFLTLLEVLKRRIAGYSVDEFYYLSRACLV